MITGGLLDRVFMLHAEISASYADGMIGAVSQLPHSACFRDSRHDRLTVSRNIGIRQQ